MSEVTDLHTDKSTGKTVDEVLVDRVGKIEETEAYSNSTEFLIMYKNDYSVIVRQNSKSNRYVTVEVYWGVGNRTLDFFKNEKMSKKVSRKHVELFLGKIEKLERVG